MEHIRINFTLNLEIWNRFILLVPKKERKNSINKLLKIEVEKITHPTETQSLASAFKEASKGDGLVKSPSTGRGRLSPGLG